MCLLELLSIRVLGAVFSPPSRSRRPQSRAEAETETRLGDAPVGKSRDPREPDLDESVQHHLAHLLLVAERKLLLGHEDAVAAVELDVCPPGKSKQI